MQYNIWFDHTLNDIVSRYSQSFLVTTLYNQSVMYLVLLKFHVSLLRFAGSLHTY